MDLRGRRLDGRAPAGDLLLRRVRRHHGEERVEGLVYVPHPETKPMHHQPATIVELLLPRLPGLAAGEVLDLEVEHGQAEFAEVARPLSHP
uniref:Uncharacterized protein n=1 Tax=Janibacter limosus TaxID=53458 RepID=A0AC61U5M3_9MICO|nr:hypothetical protein [Janibacter limosus]